MTHQVYFSTANVQPYKQTLNAEFMQPTLFQSLQKRMAWTKAKIFNIYYST